MNHKAIDAVSSPSLVHGTSSNTNAETSDESYHVHFEKNDYDDDDDDDDDASASASTYLSSDSGLGDDHTDSIVIAKLDNGRKFHYVPGNTVVLLRDITRNMEAYNRYDINSDDKFILAHITHVKRPKPKDKLSFYKNRSIASMSATQYDRSFDFVDLSDKNGGMGRVIYETKPSGSLQILCQNNWSAVGADVLLVEPQWNGAIGADYVPIFHLTSSCSVVPLGYNLKHKQYATKFPPDIPIRLDATNQSQLKYFHYKNASIHVSGIEFLKSCSGYLCDRTSQSSECFDLIKHADTGITMKCKLRFCPNKEIAMKPVEDWFMERDFTSYRFLTLFLHGDEKYEELTQDLQNIRAFITKRVKAINKQGVDIQGWYRQGKKEANVEKVEGGAMTAAARLSTEDRIASTEIFPHVSKIVCNNDKIPNQRGWLYSSDFAIDYGFSTFH